MSILVLIAFALFNNLISVIYAVMALGVLWRLKKEWRSLVDQTVTPRDTELAWKLGFFLLSPVGVLAHELSHLVTALALGAQHTSLTYLLYWGYVSYSPPLAPTSEFAVSAAGPAMSILLGLGALVLATRLRSPRHEIFQAFGTTSLALVLVIYPVMNYWSGFGDFTAIYGTSLPLTVLAGSVHAAGLLLFARLAGNLTSRSRTRDWAELANSFPDKRAHFKDEDAARLRQLESSPTRFLPGVRQEMMELRELRDWIIEHNRQIEKAEAGAGAEIEAQAV